MQFVNISKKFKHMLSPNNSICENLFYEIHVVKDTDAMFTAALFVKGTQIYKALYTMEDHAW